MKLSNDPVALEFMVFNGKPLQCEVEWGYDDNSAVQCINPAVWIADCHDELGHSQAQILFCAECKIVADYKNVCECGEQLVKNERRL